MAKRAAEDEEQPALKAGQRPSTPANGDQTLDFEDEFEDEFESEDEIMEAGVDGRPDAERETEEAKGTLPKLRYSTSIFPASCGSDRGIQMLWTSTLLEDRPSYLADQLFSLVNH